tara:strand:+ start:1842 stop:2609 length:768 start_codon:yes stop_codon:yes gene_type:complete
MLDKEIIRLYSHSGLCNRLRLLNSYRSMSEIEQREIEFHWVKCVQCWATYDELFNPIDGVNFVFKKHEKNRRKSRPENSIITMNHIVGRNEDSYNKDHVAPISIDSYQKYLLDICPIDEIRKQIDGIREELNDDYNACHIRRTDIQTVQKKYSVDPPTDKMFMDFMGSSNKKVFLATDSEKTQSLFKRMMGDRVVTFSTIKGDGSRRWPKRTTDIQSAVVDVFCCIYSKKFMGTECSSFSQFIKDYQEGIKNERH